MSGWTGVLRAKRAHRDDRVAHTVVFPAEYAQEFADIFERDRPPQDPTVYLCSQALSHGRQGWEDADPIFVMANAPCEPATGRRDPALFEALERAVLARLRAHDLMGPEDELIWSRTPSDLAAEFPGSRGSIYGAASNSQFAAFRRPPNRVARLPGLYLASGSAHPGGGVPMCLISGRTAPEEALSKELRGVVPAGVERRGA